MVRRRHVAAHAGAANHHAIHCIQSLTTPDKGGRQKDERNHVQDQRSMVTAFVLQHPAQHSVDAGVPLNFCTQNSSSSSSDSSSSPSSIFSC